MKTRCNPLIRLLAALSVLSLLNACSMLNIGKDSYSCAGIPEGVRCMSARQVYEQTHNGQRPQPIGERPSHSIPVKGAASPKAATASIDPLPHPVSASVLTPLRSLPLRTPSQVMRIWIAPWIDDRGDLMVPSYVYTEIEPRRWTIGLPEAGTQPVLRPLVSTQSIEVAHPDSKNP